MSVSALTLSRAEQDDSRFTYTPQLDDATYFSWLDAFCGDGFNRLVVRLFGPA